MGDDQPSAATGYQVLSQQSTTQHRLCPLVVNRLITNAESQEGLKVGNSMNSRPEATNNPKPFLRAGAHFGHLVPKKRSLITSTSINGNFVPAYSSGQH